MFYEPRGVFFIKLIKLNLFLVTNHLLNEPFDLLLLLLKLLVQNQERMLNSNKIGNRIYLI